MKKFLAFIAIQLCLRNALMAQHSWSFSQVATTIGFTDQNGTWELKQYPGNIIKTSFYPNNYTKGKPVSNTISAKPIKRSIQINQSFSENTIVLNKNIRVKYEHGMFRFFVDDELTLIMDEPVNENELNGFSFRLLKGEQMSDVGEQLFISSRGYGIFFDKLNFCLIPGRTTNEIMRKHARLIGMERKKRRFIAG